MNLCQQPGEPVVLEAVAGDRRPTAHGERPDETNGETQGRQERESPQEGPRRPDHGRAWYSPPRGWPRWDHAARMHRYGIAARRDSHDAFTRRLATIVLAGIAVRIAYVLLSRHVRPAGDSDFFFV